MAEKIKKSDELKTVAEGGDDAKEVINSLALSIRKMFEDRDKKASQAKDHLIAQLTVAADKYRTANGVMMALNTLREVMGKSSDIKTEVSNAKMIATGISRVTRDMRDKAAGMEPEFMDELCDEFFNVNFSLDDGTPLGMVQELMVLQLCQGVGPDACDIAEFCRTADKEIEKAQLDLKEKCEKAGLDYLEVCDEHGQCNLCESCVNVEDEE